MEKKKPDNKTFNLRAHACESPYKDEIVIHLVKKHWWNIFSSCSKITITGLKSTIPSYEIQSKSLKLWSMELNDRGVHILGHNIFIPKKYTIIGKMNYIK